MNTVIPPGSTLGILGSGQLGRMLAIEARRLGYRVQVLSPERDTPAGEIANREWVADYEDRDVLSQFARAVDVVTLEFENIPTAALEHLQRDVAVHPGPNVLRSTQNRLREKNTLRGMGIPTAPFAAVDSVDELRRRLGEFGGEGILKTASWGYDGKGQSRASFRDDLASVWRPFAGQETILEGLVDFDAELSVIAARGSDGDVRTYAPIHNMHHRHILDVSVSPIPFLSPQLDTAARDMAATIVQSLEVVGVLCVEMFLDKSGRLLVNELAPRPHNSGHLTIDAHATCQFQQQLRAVCGLPLGSTAQRQPAAMANLLGDVWAGGPPRWDRALAEPGMKLHLYGKHEPRAGRKMGHLTCLETTSAAAEQKVRDCREALVRH